MAAPPTLPPIVDAAWLGAHLAEVVVCDVRWYLDGRSGRAAYGAGHLPGATFVDLDAVLAAPASPAGGRHPLPSPEAFAAGMAGLGVGDDDAVVAYDDAGGMAAGRLVWMLRATGRRAALLDGGLAAWPGPLTTDDVPRPPAAFSPRPWPADRLATADDLASPGPPAEGRGVGGGRRVVVDARVPERYRGDAEPVDSRAGHVPGAVNVPYAGNLDPATGRFLAPEALRARFAAAGVGEGTDVVAYCGSGVSACQDLLALEAAGLGPGRLYPGSWSQWSADPDRPAATGAAP